MQAALARPAHTLLEDCRDTCPGSGTSRDGPLSVACSVRLVEPARPCPLANSAVGRGGVRVPDGRRPPPRARLRRRHRLDAVAPCTRLIDIPDSRYDYFTRVRAAQLIATAARTFCARSVDCRRLAGMALSSSSVPPSGSETGPGRRALPRSPSRGLAGQRLSGIADCAAGEVVTTAPASGAADRAGDYVRFYFAPLWVEYRWTSMPRGLPLGTRSKQSPARTRRG